MTLPRQSCRRMLKEKSSLGQLVGPRSYGQHPCWQNFRQVLTSARRVRRYHRRKLHRMAIPSWHHRKNPVYRKKQQMDSIHLGPRHGQCFANQFQREYQNRMGCSLSRSRQQVSRELRQGHRQLHLYDRHQWLVLLLTFAPRGQESQIAKRLWMPQLHHSPKRATFGLLDSGVLSYRQTHLVHRAGAAGWETAQHRR